jgi:hypothetical protein
MSDPVKPIAAIRGGASEQIQALLAEFAAGLAPDARVAGVLERQRRGVVGADPLLCTFEGRRFELFQDLGPSSTACSLDSASVVAACAAVLEEISQGCDLLILSKFGKLEAERSGLAAAFAAAVEAEVPILTSVAPKFDAEWSAFAAPLFEFLPPERRAIETWWRKIARPSAVAAGPEALA